MSFFDKFKSKGRDSKRNANDDDIASMFDEVVPVLQGRVDDPAGFARQVLDRFRNPFLDHKLSDIALHHESKVKVRLVPTALEYRVKFGKEPAMLSETLAKPQPG